MCTDSASDAAPGSGPTPIAGACGGTARPRLRRDAERNLERILRSESIIFAERGLDATLNDIAHHAGVGVGAVYRRFDDKQALIATLFESKGEQLITMANKAG